MCRGGETACEPLAFEPEAVGKKVAGLQRVRGWEEYDFAEERCPIIAEHLCLKGRSTMIRGSCLCGGVQFEFESAVGPFELCHCSRCRKSSGSQFMAGVAIRSEGFRLITGRELITKFELPVRDEPPAYARVFCSRCGCVVPDADPPQAESFEIAAGLLDDDPGVRPDRHIMVESKAPWTEFREGDLPQFDLQGLLKLRGRE